MIKQIPISFGAYTEDYITLPILKMFCNNNGLKTTEAKAGLMKSIIEFANKDADNELKVIKWFDRTLKEGVKHVFIKKIFINESLSRNKEDWEQLLINKFQFDTHRGLINSKNNNAFKLQSFHFDEVNGIINNISLNFSLLLKEIKNITLPSMNIIYPIFIDIDLKNEYIYGRCKSKANIYNINILENGTEDFGQRTNAFNLFNKLSERVLDELNIENESKERSTEKFKNIFYNMIQECTNTPMEIENELCLEEQKSKDFIKEFFERHSIDESKRNNFLNALKDISIFMEKYISINYKNQDIFTESRYAYPVKIAATDADLSSIEEASFDDKPLQCSPIFFDNKKIINKEKKCDTFAMMFKREPKIYWSKNKFPVRFSIRQGVCIVQFLSYTLEEEIQYVLSKIIKN